MIHDQDPDRRYEEFDVHANQPENSSPLKDCRVFKGEAVQKGYFKGTGKGKKRLELSSKTKLFAIALFKKPTDDWEREIEFMDQEFDKWVKLNSKQGDVYADISSIVERVGISKEEVVQLARDDHDNNTHTLEKKIMDEVNKQILPADEQPLKEKLTKKLFDDKGRYEIHGMTLARQDASEIDDSFKSGRAVRLQLNDKDNRFLIKTDGYIYQSRPPAKDKFVPYSKDGNTWILLNVKSLSNRTLLEPQEIAEAAAEDQNGIALAYLINDRMDDLLLKGMTSVKERKVFSAEASNMGPFSGNVKNRLQLSGQTNKFDVAILEGPDLFKSGHSAKNIEWVELRSKRVNDQGGHVSVDISSLSKRLGIPKERIIALAKADDRNQTHILDIEIQKKIDEYVGIQNFVKNCYLRTPNLTGFIYSMEKLEGDIINPEIKKIFNELSVKSDRELKKGIQFFPKVLEYLKVFFNELYKIDKSYFITEEKVTKPRFKIGGMKLVNEGALEIGNSTGLKAVRLQLFDDELNRYAIKTDGNIYYTKPEGNKNYVPFTEDGRNWVLLSIKSLTNRTLLSPEAIDTLNEGVYVLSDLIKNRVGLLLEINKYFINSAENGHFIDKKGQVFIAETMFSVREKSIKEKVMKFINTDHSEDDNYKKLINDLEEKPYLKVSILDGFAVQQFEILPL